MRFGKVYLLNLLGDCRGCRLWKSRSCNRAADGAVNFSLGIDELGKVAIENLIFVPVVIEVVVAFEFEKECQFFFKVVAKFLISIDVLVFEHLEEVGDEFVDKLGDIGWNHEVGNFNLNFNPKTGNGLGFVKDDDFVAMGAFSLFGGVVVGFVGV